MNPAQRVGTRSPGLRGIGSLRAIDPVISVVLRFGVLLSAAIIVAGIGLYVVASGSRAILLAPHGIPASADADPASLRVVLDQLGPRQPAAVTDLGLLVLIVTPVVSVAIATAGFGVERDWLYVGIGLLVLAALIAGFALGKA